MFLSITAVILTKNEENNISECIKSLNFCDEILIIDDYSTDRTVEIVNDLNNKKVKVIKHVLNGDFSKQRNFGLEKAQNEWVIFIDADENVSEALAFEISNAIHQLSDIRIEKKNGFYIKRKDFLWGKELNYGESGIKLLRLGKKQDGNWVGKVHEEWKIKGKIGILKNSLIHLPHQSVADFLKEINYYSSIRAKELLDKKTRVFFWSIILYPLGKFLINYFIRRGFMDGIRGLIIAVTMSFHSFLVRGKLWLMWDKK